MAANGCVSGKVSEWPGLIEELKVLGYFVGDETHTIKDVKRLCANLINYNENVMCLAS